MSKTGEVVYQISGDNSKFKQDVKETERIAASGYSGIQNVGSAAFRAIGKAATAVGIGKLVSETIELGKQFGEAFAKVETIMDTSQVNVSDMEKSIRETAVAMGVDAGELSDAVYNAISATGDTAGAVDLVATATKLAKAGFTDSTSALGVLTTAMNAYGMSADEAEELSDSLITTQNLGVLTMSELSGAMGKAIATGSAYGVNIHNLESGYIALTKSGINVNEATTYLSGMMKELGTSGSKAAKILQEKTGQSFGQLMKSGASLGDVLDVLLESVNGDTEAMMNLWGSAEAGKAANAIISQGLNTFNDNLAKVTKSAGTTQAAYTTMSETTAQKTAILQTSIKELGLSIYEDLDGPVSDATDNLTGYVQKLSKAYSTEGMTGMVEAAGGVVSDMIGKIVEKIPDVISAGIDFLLALAKGFAKNLPTIVPKMIKGLVDAMVSLVSNFKGILQIGIQIVTGILKGIVSAIPALIKGLGDALQGLVNGVNPYADKLETKLDEVAEAYESAVDNMAETADTLNTSLGTIGAKSAEADRMIDRLAELEAQSSLTNEEQEEWNRLLEILGETIPGINELIDEETGSIEGGVEALKNYAEAWYESARAEAYAQAAKELISEEIELERQLTEAKQAQFEVQGELNGAEQTRQAIMAKVNKLTGGHITDVETLTDALNDLKGGEHDSNGEISRMIDLLNKANATTDKYTPLLEDATEAVDDLTTAHDECASKIDYYLDKESAAKEAAGEYADATEDAADDIEGAYGDVTTAATTSATGVETASGRATDAFTEIADVSGRMGLKAQGNFLAMVKKIKTDGGTLTDNQKRMAENILKNYEDIEPGMEKAGKDAILGVISGMNLTLDQLGVTADASAETIVSALKNYLQIESPSKLLQTKVGQQVDAGLIKGMKDKESEVSAEAATVASKIKTGIDSKKWEVETAGKSLGTGLIGGLDSGTSWVMQRIGGWCSGIISKLKSKLGIHSPSTVVKEEIGENMALAIPVAFEAEEFDAEKRIGKSVRAMIDGPLAGLTMPDINLLGGLSTGAGSTGQPVVLQLQLDAEMNVDGLTLGTVLLRNLDDASAFVLPA